MVLLLLSCLGHPDWGMGMVGVVMVVALPLSEMPLCSWEWWGAAPALAVFPTTMWTPALLKTSLSRWGEWDPTLCPPRALALPHSLSLWVCLLFMDKAGDEKEAQGAACTTRSCAQR